MSISNRKVYPKSLYQTEKYIQKVYIAKSISKRKDYTKSLYLTKRSIRNSLCEKSISNRNKSLYEKSIYYRKVYI